MRNKLVGQGIRIENAKTAARHSTKNGMAQAITVHSDAEIEEAEMPEGVCVISDWHMEHG